MEAELTDILDYISHGRITVKNSREEAVCEEQGTGGTCYVPDTPFLFGSMYRSRRTGLSYMRNRWYSARLKQFLSPDPAGYVDSYNPYAYVAFDPINGWDPYGLEKDFYHGSPLGIVEGVYQMGRDDGMVEQTLDAATDLFEWGAEKMKEDGLERDSVMGGIEYSTGEVIETLAPKNAEQFMFDISVGLGLSGVRIGLQGIKVFDDFFSGADDALRVGKIL